MHKGKTNQDRIMKTAFTRAGTKCVVGFVVTILFFYCVPAATVRSATLCEDLRTALAQAPNFMNLRGQKQDEDIWSAPLKIGDAKRCYVQQFIKTDSGLICEISDFVASAEASTAYSRLLAQIKTCAPTSTFGYRDQNIHNGSGIFVTNDRDKFGVSLTEINVPHLSNEGITKKQIFKLQITVYSIR
jgi:hypothetical protein